MPFLIFDEEKDTRHLQNNAHHKPRSEESGQEANGESGWSRSPIEKQQQQLFGYTHRL